MKKFALTVAAAALLVGAFVAIAEEPKKTTGDKPTATSAPANDAATALKDVQAAKELLNADKKAEAIAKLDEAIKLLQKLAAAPTPTPAPTAAPAAGGGNSFSGEVRTTMSRHQPRITVNGTQYELVAAASADAATKETIAKIAAGTATGSYTVKGTLSGSAISVESITKN